MAPFTAFVLLVAIATLTLAEGEKDIQARQEACSLPVKKGPCTDELPRFFYNSETGKCEEFQYGGCEGNENNFVSLNECEMACDIQARQKACSLPVKKGPCMYEFPRFFYNSEAGKCEEFQYGGCEGNNNNFGSLNECEMTCGPS